MELTNSREYQFSKMFSRLLYPNETTQYVLTRNSIKKKLIKTNTLII